jgi:hypothetical protein
MKCLYCGRIGDSVDGFCSREGCASIRRYAVRTFGEMPIGTVVKVTESWLSDLMPIMLTASVPSLRKSCAIGLMGFGRILLSGNSPLA